MAIASRTIHYKQARIFLIVTSLLLNMYILSFMLMNAWTLMKVTYITIKLEPGVCDRDEQAHCLVPNRQLRFISRTSVRNVNFRESTQKLKDCTDVVAVRV
jgi:hypothetical protein